jgi:flagellar assembly protein FliH
MTMSDADVHTVRLSDAKSSSGFRPLFSSLYVNAISFAAPDTHLPISAGGDQYENGFAAGHQSAQESFEIERANYNALIASAQAMQSEPSDELAALIAATVSQLVHKITGSTPIDGEWLNRHASSAAALVADCDMARTLWVHPDDIELIDQAAIGLTLIADPGAERGSISVECSQGWIEHGRALYLDRLSGLLDLQEQSA